MMSFLRFRNAKGQASIEVAIAIILLLAVLFFVWDMSMISYHWIALQFAANEGARVGTVNHTLSESDIENYTRQFAGYLGVNSPTVTATLDSGMLMVRAEKGVFFTPLTKLVFQLTGLGDSFKVYAFAQRREEPVV